MTTFFTKTALLALTGAFLLAGCEKNGQTPEPDNTPQTRPLTEQEARNVSSSNDFAFRIFAGIRASQATQNVFISPLSVSTALTMAYNGADGTTKEAMRQTLGFAPQTDQAIGQAYQSLSALLTGLDRTVQFASANSIWHGQQYTLQPSFAQLNQTYFGATVQGVNFASPTAKSTINNWVSAKTNNRIPTIVDATQPEDVLYLINAIYFKGTWTYKFDRQLTRDAPFQKTDGTTVQAKFMALKNGKYGYFADATKQVIDLPYGNQQFSMTFVLPAANSSVAALLPQLTSANLSTWLSTANTTSLELRVPKFNMQYERKLNDDLTQLGMGEAFTDRANFSKMVQGMSSGLQISEVKHKTFLQVDEEGTEAAAATSVGMVFTSVPMPILLDRPFVFLIREKSTNAILFIGQLMQP